MAPTNLSGEEKTCILVLKTENVSTKEILRCIRLRQSTIRCLSATTCDLPPHIVPAQKSKVGWLLLSSPSIFSEPSSDSYHTRFAVDSEVFLGLPGQVFEVVQRQVGGHELLRPDVEFCSCTSQNLFHTHIFSLSDQNTSLFLTTKVIRSLQDEHKPSLHQLEES